MAVIAGISKGFEEFQLELATMDKDSLMFKLVTSDITKEDCDYIHIKSPVELRNLIFFLRQIEDIYTTIYPVK